MVRSSSRRSAIPMDDAALPALAVAQRAFVMLPLHGDKLVKLLAKELGDFWQFIQLDVAVAFQDFDHTRRGHLHVRGELRILEFPFFQARRDDAANVSLQRRVVAAVAIGLAFFGHIESPNPNYNLEA